MINLIMFIENFGYCSTKIDLKKQKKNYKRTEYNDSTQANSCLIF